MAWYCYWSAKKQASWNLVVASEREKIAASGRAEFITALDLDIDLSDEQDPEYHENVRKVRYSGDFYLDFDADTIEQSAGKVREFLAHLRDEYEVGSNQVRIFASGKKGFHVEIPRALFIAKVSTTGYVFLPAIYREMAAAMYFDTMDLAVYTAKMGRQWRVPNVKRPDGGTYKVQVTPQEVEDMTPDLYREIVAIPRPLFPVQPPALSGKMATLWATSKDRVEARMKRLKDRKRGDEIIQMYGGKIPATIDQVMDGEGVKDGVGFQALATQLAIVAHGFKMDKDTFLAKCAGLIEKHVGDGTRYGTVAKRKAELSRMWSYMSDNLSYEFSPSALRALVSHNAPDLIAVEGDGGEGIEPIECDEEKEDLAITMGMSVSRNGIYKLVDGSFRQRVSQIGMTDPVYLVDTLDGQFFGYDVNVYLDGEPQGKRRITLQHFSSKAKFQGLLAGVVGGSCQITDAQVNGLLSVFHKIAKRNGGGGTMYVVNHEGLDIVTLPDGKRDIFWVEQQGVLSRERASYTYFNGVYGGTDHPFKTDLLSAPRIPHGGTMDPNVPYLDEAQVEFLKRDLHHLLRINTDMVVAKVVGWGVACFLCPALRLTHDHQFPLLHVYGPASAGKSTTMRAVARLHGYHRPPQLASAGNSTLAPLTTKVTGTTSIPFVIDEYKPTEMSSYLLDNVTNMLRGVFDGALVSRGRLSKDNGESQVVTASHAQVAPTCFISEQLENDTAILQRSLIVSMTPQDDTEFTTHIKAVLSSERGGEPTLLGAVGRHLVEYLIFSDDFTPERIHQIVRKYEADLEESGAVKGPASDRPRYAVAVALTGLEFLKSGLRTVFQDEYDARIEELQQALLNPASGKATLVARIQPAIVKVLNYLAEMSATKSSVEDHNLAYEGDYVFLPDGDIEINAFSCYTKYMLHTRRSGERQQFSGTKAFQAALDQYPGATKSIQPHITSMRNVYRLSTQRMYEVDGVAEFVPPPQ